MSVPFDSAPADRHLVQYLLGLLSEEETERLDEQSITDDDIADRLRIVEHDLIDAYISGTLDAATRAQFERVYLSSPRRREKVRFAESLRQVVDRAARVDPVGRVDGVTRAEAPPVTRPTLVHSAKDDADAARRREREDADAAGSSAAPRSTDPRSIADASDAARRRDRDDADAVGSSPAARSMDARSAANREAEARSTEAPSTADASDAARRRGRDGADAVRFSSAAVRSTGARSGGDRAAEAESTDDRTAASTARGAGAGLMWALAAAAVLLLVVGGVLLVQTMRLRQELTGVQTERAALENRAHELERQLGDQRTANADALKELARIRALLAETPSRPGSGAGTANTGSGASGNAAGSGVGGGGTGAGGINAGGGTVAGGAGTRGAGGAGTGGATGGTGGSRSGGTGTSGNAGGASSSGAGVASVVATALILTPQMRAAGPIPTIAIRPGATGVAFDLMLESNEFPRYQVTARDPGTNGVIWRGERLAPTTTRQAAFVSIVVPAHLLKAQHYTLDLSGLRPGGGEPEPVGSYTFRVALMR